MGKQSRPLYDEKALLFALSRRYVASELGIDLKQFTLTPDIAWVSVAARKLNLVKSPVQGNKLVSKKR